MNCFAKSKRLLAAAAFIIVLIMPASVNFKKVR